MTGVWVGDICTGIKHLEVYWTMRSRFVPPPGCVIGLKILKMKPIIFNMLRACNRGITCTYQEHKNFQVKKSSVCVYCVYRAQYIPIYIQI